jgi:hypothetical protein
MVFWGIISPDFDIATVGYPKAMLINIGLWLSVMPMAWRAGGQTWQRGEPKRKWPAPTSSDAPDLNATAVFSGFSRKVTSQDFRSAKVTAVFGGGEVDLRGAQVLQRPARIEVTAVFGGIEIKVPADWRVELNVTGAAGGASDERPGPVPSGEGAPDLVVTGTFAFGGVSVKS